MELELLLPNVREEDLPISAVEGRQTRNHLIEYDSKTPPVAGEAVLALALEDLGGEVFGRADEAPRLLILVHVLLGESEVGEHGEAFGVYEHVFWFQAENMKKASLLMIRIL